ncbi:L-erythro-3,5-diaminohexanoate dehydrogenase [Myxococcus landrumensis]|uniref:L-erythro-3,5-diaminohexanoate dehydrogenase n=1 Tax=Myxococcus landrumensis TaxID=2813577 RepID=A0ABX7NKR3_9BACT|nr:L-erythro-3,5-diaminohexanoate dehydrogenase [Myxococcus landrumus]QSQ18112.1 L-erythro-3,5-diaminohexanoate dehydrogenase [Myxococcus landrumus]
MSNDLYGLSRVVGEKGVLPQRARKLDPSLPCRDTEMLIDVESLNIDAASFKQIKGEVGGDPARIGERIQEIVRERGKMQNPVTGSGGMLIGRVKEIGAKHPAREQLQVGDRIATLVSLTLTPLVIEEVKAVHVDIDRVDIRGHALLFSSGIYAKLPSDIPDTLALAALDVCGAPALVARYVKPGMTVAVLGAGKSGALCLAQARRNLESRGKLIALDVSQSALDVLSSMGLCDVALKVDATQGVDVMEAVSQATQGQLCDLVVNCASVGNTEMATILSVKDGGTAIFFSMATSFTTAALGAEGVGKDVTMLVGNGFVPGHASLTLALLRTEPALLQLFATRYV